MKRRKALKILGAVTALPVLGQISADELAALGVELRGATTPRPITGQLTYLNAHQNATVTRIADLIIPRTDTPGAADVGVNEFIDRIVGGWYSALDRGRFISDLTGIDTTCRQRWGGTFVDLDQDNQVGFLTELEEESLTLKEEQDAAAAEARGPGPYPYPTRVGVGTTSGATPGAVAAARATPWDDHIFQRLKFLTLHGYYTSQEGAVQELHFRMVPGEFQGCVPYEEMHGHPTRGNVETPGGHAHG